MNVYIADWIFVCFTFCKL